MKTKEEILESKGSLESDSFNRYYKDMVEDAMQTYADQFTPKWIDVNDGNMPDYKTKVLVKRPNEYSGKVDILMAYYNKVEPAGQTYGHMGTGGITFKDFWSLPAIAPHEDITHWMPIPTE